MLLVFRKSRIEVNNKNYTDKVMAKKISDKRGQRYIRRHTANYTQRMVKKKSILYKIPNTRSRWIIISLHYSLWRMERIFLFRIKRSKSDEGSTLMSCIIEVNWVWKETPLMRRGRITYIIHLRKMEADNTLKRTK